MDDLKKIIFKIVFASPMSCLALCKKCDEVTDVWDLAARGSQILFPCCGFGISLCTCVFFCFSLTLSRERELAALFVSWYQVGSVEALSMAATLISRSRWANEEMSFKGFPGGILTQKDVMLLLTVSSISNMQRGAVWLRVTALRF